MNSILAKKPASVMRQATQPVRDHTAAMQRLQDQYFAALSRANAVYFDGVKRVTEAVAQMTEPAADTPAAEAAPATPPS